MPFYFRIFESFNNVSRRVLHFVFFSALSSLLLIFLKIVDMSCLVVISIATEVTGVYILVTGRIYSRENKKFRDR